MAARRARPSPQRLVDLSFADTVFFTNSGAEAVECAIKTARRYHHHHGRPEKHELITFANAFHGRTLGAISATNQEKMRDGFAPLLPGFHFVAFDDLEAAKAAIGPQHRRLPRRADPGRGRHPPGQPGIHDGPARARRRARPDARPRRGPVRLWPHRQVFAHEHYGIVAGHHGGRQGHRRRLSDRRLPRHREGGGRHGDRHPRLDLWRQPARLRRRPGGARRGRRRRASSPMSREWAKGCAARSSR